MKTVLVFRTTNRGTWRETFGGMTGFAKSAGWQLQPVDARKARPDFRALLDFWHPVGVVIDASGGTAFFKGADFGGLPAVAINPEDELAGGNMPAVANDADEISRLAMEELLRLAPESLLFVGWFAERDWCVARRKVAQKVATLHGMSLRLVSPEPGDAANPIHFIECLAIQIAALPKPCGIYAVADDVGRLVLAASVRLGLDIPGDVSVVSVDDDPEVCENCTPTLTSIRPDYRGLGFEAALVLKRLIDGETPPSVTTVSVAGVMRRASTVVLRRRDPKVAEALEMIRLHACDGLRTARVAAVFGTSLHTAEDRFRAATGQTIGQAIMDRRLSTACDYLRAGRSSIEAIANFCGWTSAVAFRKAFIARFGLPPGKWTQSRQRVRRRMSSR